MSLRKLALVTLVVSVILVLPATGAFSSTSAERGVKVSIVDDYGLLGFEQKRSNVNYNQSTTDLNVTVTNRLGADLSFTVTVNNHGPTERADNPPVHKFSFDDIECGGTIHVEASGSGVEIDLYRTVPTC